MLVFIQKLKESKAKIEAKMMLELADDFRTANWVEMIKYPELVYSKSMDFLS